MPASDINLADRTGGLVEAHKSYQPRIVFFYLVIALLFSILAGGLVYRQIFQRSVYDERERIQNHRRIVTPGPRGDILDRDGHIIAGSKSQVSVVLLLDGLRGEFKREAIKIHNNYVKAIEDDTIDMSLPTDAQLNRIARVTVLQRYLDSINRITGQDLRVDQAKLEYHFSQRLLLPFVLVSDLEPSDYARLIEQLPVNSPLQVTPSIARIYPYGSAAAHVIGSVKEDDIEAADLPQKDLQTFKMPGLVGRDWLEARFDTLLQGKAGGKILRVDPAGYKIDPPVYIVDPKKGMSLNTSLDMDLQQAAEAKLAELQAAGAAVALDVRTGEVLVLASSPTYDLNSISPRFSKAVDDEIKIGNGWYNRAVQGAYPPGSSFKILITIAGMRAGKIDPESEVDCPGYYMVGNKKFLCHDGKPHGLIKLADAIRLSCNVFFYKHGILTDIDAIAAEGKRFGFGSQTGIELPGDRRGLMPDRAWKKSTGGGSWTDGDTANVSIGQGAVDVSPIQMASFIASVARGETRTTPTLIHDPKHPLQHTEPIGLSPANYKALVDDMIKVTQTGTAKTLSLPSEKINGLTIAGKTGTAQRPTAAGNINFAWFICFAPAENPQIAIAVCVEGDVAGEEFGGGTYAAPIANQILKAWWAKKNPPSP